MTTINRLQGYAFAKKKGDVISLFEGQHMLSDFAPVIAEGSTTPRMLKDRFADVVNVRDYGAVGDGVADDTNSFKAAIESGKTVFIPNGSYKLTQYVYAKFIASDRITFTEKNANVSVLASVDSTFRKGIVAEIPFKFPDFEEAKQVTDADLFSVQGLSYDDESNLYLLYEAVKENQSVKTVVARYNDQYKYSGYVVLPPSTENIIVSDVTGERSIYVRNNETKELFQYKIDGLDFYGQEISGTPVIADVNGEYAYSNRFFYVFSGSSDYPSGPASRTLIKKFNEKFEFVGNVFVPQSVTGFISTSAPYYTFIPKSQGFCVIDGSFYFEHGNGWIPPENDSGATDYTYYRVHDVGCSLVSPDGSSVLKYGVIRGWDFVKRLRALGYDVTKLETEGCTCHPDGSIHACYLTKEGTQSGADKTGILIVREFDTNGEDYSDIKSEYSPLNIQRYINGVFPAQVQSGSDGRSYVDPFSLKKITKLSEMLDLMSAFGIPYLSFYTNTLNVEPINGISLPSGCLVEIKNSNNISVFITVSFAGSDSNDGKRFYYASNYSGQWVASSKNVAVNKLLLDASTANSRIVSIGDDGSYTPVVSINKDSDGSYRLRFGSSDSDLKGSTVIEFWAAKDSDRRRVLAYQYSAVYPGLDQQVSLGTASNRWTQLFASSGTINTSDARCKTSVASASDALLDAVGNVPIHTFQFTDAVEKKGTDAARLHVGVVAQEVDQAFKDKGLDASRYGLFCHDEWQDEYEEVEVVDQPEVLDEEGNVVTPKVSHMEKRQELQAGDRYGIRYEELLVLECARLRRETERQQQELQLIRQALLRSGITV